MQNEIAAATSHLSTLLVAAAPSNTTTSSSPPSSSILTAWQQSLSTTLHASLSRSGNWYPADPERGSAARALHWQPLAGGEGCSSLLIDACRKHTLTFAAGQWTLWIDPSCVAIRMGPGPGRVSNGSAADFGSAAAMSAANFTDGIKVIYGSLPIPRIARSPAYTHAQVHAPSQHALFAPATSKAAVISRPQAAGNAGNRVPSVTVSPSTPALDRTVVTTETETALQSADATPVVPWTSSFAAGSLGLTGLGLGARRRARRSSSSSSTSSSGSGGSSNVSRDSSSSRGLGALEATSSVGTSLPASSPPATWDKLGDDEVPEPQDGESVDDAVVPSAPAPAPLSLRNVDLLGLGLEDCGLDEADALAPEDAISVTGGQEQDEAEEGEDERDGEGDDTIRSLNEADETICATVAEDKVVPAPAQQPARPTTTTSRHSRTSSTVSSASSSVTSFDNGNVGVLGGGVKLGGASSSSASSASSATGGRRSRAMSGTSNHSGSASSRASLQHSRTLSRTGGWAAQQQREVQMQMQMQMQGGWYQQQQQQQQPQHQYAPQQQWAQQPQHQQHQFQYPAPPQQQGGNALGLNNMAAPPTAQYPRQQIYEFQPLPQQHQQQQPSSFPPAPPLEIVPLYKRREAGPPSQQKFSINVTLATADEANASRMPTSSRPASAASTLSHDGSGSKLNNGNNGNGCLTPNSATLAPLPSPALSSTGSTTSSFGGETDEGDDNDSEGEDDEQEDGASKPRRTRTRGRRSRGRGAGRAARRAAAAAAAAAATAACLPPGVAGVAGAFPTPPVGAFGSPAVGAVGSPMVIGGAWGKPLPSPTGASPFLQQQQRMMFNNNSSSPQMSGMGSPAMQQHQHAIPPRPAFNGGGARPQHPLQQQQQQHQRMMPPQQFGTPSLAASHNGNGGW